MYYLKNALIQGIVTNTPPPRNSYLGSCHHALGRRRLLITPGTIQQKGGEETMICFIKIQSENM